jgi:hypothetical protein
MEGKVSTVLQRNNTGRYFDVCVVRLDRTAGARGSFATDNLRARISNPAPETEVYKRKAQKLHEKHAFSRCCG